MTSIVLLFCEQSSNVEKEVYIFLCLLTSWLATVTFQFGIFTLLPGSFHAYSALLFALYLATSFLKIQCFMRCDIII